MERLGDAAGLTRRQFVRYGAAGAGLSLAAAVLTACGPRQRAARPTSAGAVITVGFEAWGINGYLSTTEIKLYGEVLAKFEAQNRGIRVTVVPENKLGYLNGEIAATLAGTGPDILYGTHFGALQRSALLAPLDAYLERDGIHTSIWSSAQVQAFTSSGQLFAVPVYQGAVQYAFDLTTFDQAAVPLPAEDWTHEDFIRLCQRLTIPAGKHARRGGMVFFSPQGTGGSISWLFKAFGGSQLDATGTRSVLDSQQAIAAGRWLYRDLVWQNLLDAGFGPAQIPSGSAVMVPIGTWMLPQVAETYGGLNWQIFPVPNFPAGRATFGNSDFYGLNAQSQHPEQAWELMKWVSTEPTWQQAMIQLLLAPPAVSSLWSAWESAVVAVAPNLAGKGLSWFRDAAVHGYAYPQAFYPFGATEAEAVLGDYLSALWQQQTPSVTGALTAANGQINAIFAATAPFLQRVQQARGELAAAAASSGPVTFPAPSITGAGTAPAAADQLVQKPAVLGGVWTVTGDGAGTGSITDNFVFASSALTRDVGTYTLRVDGIYNVDCPSLNPYLQVGLMGRADLSADAACVAVYVTAGHGLGVQLRNEPTLVMSAYTAPKTGSRSGLISAPYLTQAKLPTASSANALLAPVWLRLVRSAAGWQGYSSLDGKNWAPAGTRLQPMMAGCWVGLFACAANATFKDHGRIRAVVTPLDFQPSNFSLVGGPG